jgi:hypothetical protein
MKPSLVAGLLAIALLTPQGGAALQGEPTSDDALVMAAVLEATILPAYRLANSGTSNPLAVVSETSPLCVKVPPGPTGCRIPEPWRQFLVPDTARGWSGLVADDGTRKELVASFEGRNAESHPLPLSAYPGIVLLDLSKDSPAGGLDRDYRRMIGSSSLSLPGYSTDGHALMSAGYSCGSLCGYSWLFVLEKVGGRWQVKSATVTAIS